MVSSSSSVRGRFRSSISLFRVKACICSGVMDMRWPGVGVAMAMAFCPVGVVPLGVKDGVMPDTPLGVMPPGVLLGVMPLMALGVMDSGVAAPGVSSQRDRLLLAPGVGVSWMRSPPRSVRGVSAQPLPWPGVSVVVKAL